MGLLADFFVADQHDALRYARRHRDADDGDAIRAALAPVESKGLTSVEIGTLWAILEGADWDAGRHGLASIDLGDDEADAWLERFPDGLVQRLAAATPEQLDGAARAWAATEELRCDAADLRPGLDELQRLSRRAIAEGRSVFLWGSL